MAHPLSDDELVELLTGSPPHTAKLATVRPDGRPHVAPVWFALDRSTAAADSPLGDLLFNTGADTVKGRSVRHDPRVSLCIDDERPPFAFVVIEGTATISEDPAELLHWATVLGGRYMGAARGQEFARRNAVPGELLVRVRPTHVVAVGEMAT